MAAKDVNGHADKIDSISVAPRRRPPSTNLGRTSFGIQRAVMMLQDRQQEVQTRTFTRWMNSHICKWKPPLQINNLFQDIRDGKKLLILLQILSGERLKIEKPSSMQRVHYLTNVQTALKFLEGKKIKLVNINPADVVDGKKSIVLGLFWTIILYFQIEELTNNLNLGDLSASCSSLDSFSDETPKRKKSGAKSKWKGAAKKALLQWVKKKTMKEYLLDELSQPGGFNIPVKDFKESWRDGKAFNSMIHSIDPKLVDMEQVQTRTNRVNLENAFDTAEKHLGIPRLLEPEDVDVDNPDEKSIMTYVAQFVQQFPNQGDTPEQPVDADIIQYEDILAWLMDAEPQLTEVHKRFRYRTQDYKDLVDFEQKFDLKQNEAQSLCDKLSSGEATSISEEQINTMEAMINKIEESKRKWHKELDSRLPGQLGEVGAWLHEAEAVLSHSPVQSEDSEEMANAVKQRLDEHRAVFKKINIMNQLFTKFQRSSKFSGQQVSSEQLKNIGSRLQAASISSKQRSAHLEFMESKYRVLGCLATAETLLKNWTVKYEKKSTVDILLENYKVFVDDENFLDKFTSHVDELSTTADAYLKLDLDPEERRNVKQFVDEKLSQVEDMCVEIKSVRTMLEEVGGRWEEYETCVTRLQEWLEQAENSINTEGKDGKDFFTDLSDWVSIHNSMNECGNFLIETCNESVARETGQQLLLINGRWKEVFDICKQYMKEDELRKMQDDFASGAEDLLKHIDNIRSTIHEPTPIAIRPVQEHLEDLEEIRASTLLEIENRYKRMSKVAQDMVKDIPKEQVDNMLATMTTLKDDFIEVRDKVNDAIDRCSRMLEPLHEVESDLRSVDEWLQNAEDVLEDYGQQGRDAEQLYETNKELMHHMESQDKKRQHIEEALSAIKELALPEMVSSHLDKRVSTVKERLIVVDQESKDWHPKLEVAHERGTEYRDSLSNLATWLNDAQKILTLNPMDPKCMDKHQKFFNGMSSPEELTNFIACSTKLRDATLSESDRSKLRDVESQIQLDCQAVLKKASIRFLKLKFEQCQRRLDKCLENCKKQMKREEDDSNKKNANLEMILKQHEKFFSAVEPEIAEQLSSMEELTESFQVMKPTNHSFRKRTNDNKNVVDKMIKQKDILFQKLSQLPQKWAEFSAMLSQATEWANNAESVIEVVHKPIAAESDNFKELADQFESIESSRNKQLLLLESLSKTLAGLVHIAHPDTVNDQRESLVALTNSSKAVINALDVTNARIEAVQNCIKYKENAEALNEEMNELIMKTQNLMDKISTAKVDNIQDAGDLQLAFQGILAGKNTLLEKVMDEITNGKELHSNEQSPAFHYAEVAGLEKQKSKMDEVVGSAHTKVQDIVSAWTQYDEACINTTQFIENTLPHLDVQPRLNNLKAIEQEIAAKSIRHDDVLEAESDFTKAEELLDTLTAYSSKNGSEKITQKHEDIKNDLEQLKSKVGDSLAAVESIKHDWLSCEQEVNDMLQWLDEIHHKVLAVATSPATPEECFESAQKYASEIQSKLASVSQLEDKCNSIDGLEVPNALHTKLAALKDKWGQANTSAESLVASIGEHFTHQEKFEATKKQLEDELKNAEENLQLKLEECCGLDDIIDRKEDVQNHLHKLEQVRLGLATLGTEAKLLKDSKSVQADRQLLQKRYQELVSSFKDKLKQIDEAITMWHRYDHDVKGVRQFIDRCDNIVGSDVGALPGDQNKLKNELNTAEKLSNDVPVYKDALEGLRDSINEINEIIPLDMDVILSQISAMEVLLSNFPKQFVERRRVIASALASHMQYNDTVNSFTSWLFSFEKSLRASTHVYLDDVTAAQDMIKRK